MRSLRAALQPVLAVGLGLGAGLLVTMAAGENPIHVLGILARSAFGSMDDFGMTLFYATPLLFTGLSVGMAFHAGLFNIGAEGRLALGALAAAAVGILLPELPSPWAPLLAGTAAFAAGAVWGFIPGWLRATRGSHEVITTIMMNFIAAGLASWVTLYWLRNLESQNPETASIGPGYVIPHLDAFGDAPVSVALGLALVAAATVRWLLWRTALGYEIRAVGENPQAARAAGIREGRTWMVAMALAGGP